MNMTSFNNKKQQETSRLPSFMSETDKVKRFKMFKRMFINRQVRMKYKDHLSCCDNLNGLPYIC